MGPAASALGCRASFPSRHAHFVTPRPTAHPLCLPQRPGLRQLFEIDLAVLEKVAEQLDKGDEATRDFKVRCGLLCVGERGRGLGLVVCGACLLGLRACGVARRRPPAACRPRHAAALPPLQGIYRECAAILYQVRCGAVVCRPVLQPCRTPAVLLLLPPGATARTAQQRTRKSSRALLPALMRVPQEVDYINEGRNADRFRRNFSSEGWVLVPRVMWEFTAPSVLTLEYLPGARLRVGAGQGWAESSRAVGRGKGREPRGEGGRRRAAPCLPLATLSAPLPASLRQASRSPTPRASRARGWTRRWWRSVPLSPT